MNPHDLLFVLGMLIVAVAYSCVGHGGASGYLALMAFSTVATKDASVLALALNIVVSSVAFLLFKRGKHFDWSLAWPFLVGSVPFAFLGGTLKLSDHVHQWILAAVLIYAAGVLLIGPSKEGQVGQAPSRAVRMATGSGIGLVSGMVGVGGGIFLSPLMLLLGWADAKRTAATSSLFILVNSIAGLAARPPSSLNMVSSHWPTIVAASIGALVGAWIGSQRMPNPVLRRALGVVLLAGVVKLFAK